MSGPKTSQLEIERMIRAQLEALRSDVDHGRARARRRMSLKLCALPYTVFLLSRMSFLTMCS